MELLKSLLRLLGPGDLLKLRKLCEKDKSLHCRLLLHLIVYPSATDHERIKELGITKNTYHKTCTVAKDFLWNRMKEDVRTSYDDVFLLRQLLMKGELDTASRVYSQLEKDMEMRQEWQQLDALYIEGFRLCQIKGDVKKIRDISSKRTANAKRTAVYVGVYGDIIVEMIALEGYKQRKPDNKKYTARLKELGRRAMEVDHHVLIHNVLVMEYLFYMRYTNRHDAAWQTVQAMLRNASRFKMAMNDITRATVHSNHVNFLSICSGYGDPDTHAVKLLKEIDHGGNWLRANLCYAMLEYNLYSGKDKQVARWMMELEEVEDNSKFAQYRYSILAIQGFVNGDFQALRRNLALFYDNPSHLDFPDMEVTLRLLEILALIRENELKLAEPRLTALRMYIARNLDSDRYEQEKLLLNGLTRYVLNNDLRALKRAQAATRVSHYRNIEFLSRQLAEIFNLAN